jgi:outer membrane biogenesis lipoprotein LolB
LISGATTLIKRMMSRFGLAALLLLGACATRPEIEPAPLVFAAEGRLSLVARQSAAEPRQMTARFIWTETERITQVDMLGPLGETLLRLRVGPYLSELQSNQGIETAASPEQLLQKYFAAPVPVPGLRFWLRGQDKSGQRRAPQAFEEDGWRMEYTQMFPDSSQLPRIVRLQRVLPEPGASVEIRLVIDQWKP